MKKLFKRLSAVTLAALLLVTTVAVPVMASDSFTSVQTYYKNPGTYYISSIKKYVSDNQLPFGVYAPKKVTALKSSNTSIATVKYRPDPMVGTIYATAKKPGTVRISYKNGKTPYSFKVKFLNYTLPFKYLKIGNLNLTSKFKTKNEYVLPYSKYKNKTITLSYKMLNGWGDVYFKYLEKPTDRYGTALTNGKRIKITQKNSVIELRVGNLKTTQSEVCRIRFK